VQKKSQNERKLLKNRGVQNTQKNREYNIKIENFFFLKTTSKIKFSNFKKFAISI